MKRCLIVVDYQGDFVAGAYGFPGAEALAEPIAAKMCACHAAGDDVLVTLDAAAEPALYGAAGKAMTAEDRVFCKAHYGSRALMAYLSRTPYEAIELAGVQSYVCVLANVILAQTAQPDTPIVVDRRCVAGPDEALHRAALRVMQGMKVRLIGEDLRAPAGNATSGVEYHSTDLP